MKQYQFWHLACNTLRNRMACWINIYPHTVATEGLHEKNKQAITADTCAHILLYANTASAANTI
jgi:hypothetical protein